jgi:hypothetical protein
MSLVYCQNCDIYFFCLHFAFLSDLKAENLLLSGELDIKIADFGTDGQGYYLRIFINDLLQASVIIILSERNSIHFVVVPHMQPQNCFRYCLFLSYSS